MNDDYQPGFYLLDTRVRDAASRRRQAHKIAGALVRHGAPMDGVCLDVGCSAGDITRAVAPLFRATVGIDYDGIALSTIDGALHRQVLFINGDAMHLPVRDGGVNVAICAQVYEHVPDADQLFEELYRVLVPGGIVFFSGPNALYPIEPHYHIPFLHWLPRRWADRIVALTGRGERYHERSRSPWGMRRMVRRFEVRDITLDVLRERYEDARNLWAALIRAVPTLVWRLLLPLFPNYNWILVKQGGHAADARSGREP